MTKLRVVFYARVSTDHEDQLHSFAAQQDYFKKYILSQPDMIFIRGYADEGISGTSTKHRKQFLRMMEDARLGLFDLILTKEVSRFARNTVDTLSYTRELSRLNIGKCTRLLQFYKLMKRRVGNPTHGVVKGAKDINS